MNTVFALGKFVNADKFYIALGLSTMLYNFYTSITITSNWFGEIYSSDPNESCYSMQTTLSTPGVIAPSSALTDSSSTSFFISLTVSLTLNIPASTNVAAL